MTFKTMIATSAVALAVVTSAMADSNFTGAYVGANAGYGFGSTKVTNKLAAFITNYDASLKGAIGGLHGGYQHQFGMFVAGVEASANLSNTKGSETTYAQTPLANILVKTISDKRKHAFGLAARLGVDLNSWMVYTKLGWENAKFESKGDANTALQGIELQFSGKSNRRSNAFVTGLGFETLVAKNMMIGAEWTTSFYDTKKMADRSVKILRIGDFKVRLGYKF
jgi:opacity protein-like surface antigen